MGNLLRYQIYKRQYVNNYDFMSTHYGNVFKLRRDEVIVWDLVTMFHTFISPYLVFV